MPGIDNASPRLEVYAVVGWFLGCCPYCANWKYPCGIEAPRAPSGGGPKVPSPDVVWLYIVLGAVGSGRSSINGAAADASDPFRMLSKVASGPGGLYTGRPPFCDS